MAKITIIGAGELGRALGSVLRQHQLAYWDKDETRLRVVVSGELPDLPESMIEADFVFLCLSSWNLKEALAFLQPYWPRSAVAVIWSKGFDGPTKKLTHEIASKLLPPKVGLVSAGGAMLAEEIGAGRQGACLLVGEDAPKVAELFAGTKISVRVSDDLDGLAWAGVLKNVYALGLGLAEGLGYSLAERAIVFGRMQIEAGRLIKILGGQRETWLAPEITADFLITSFSSDSLNHQIGFELGRFGPAESTGKISEGLMSLPPLLERLGSDQFKFPLLLKLADIFCRQSSPASFQEIFD